MNANDIKEYALKIGFDKAGITHPDCIEKYTEIVRSKNATYDYFLRALTKPYQKSMHDVKSIIVLVKDYFEKEFPDSMTDMIGKVYLARCYTPPEGTVEHARIKLMKEFLIQDNISVKEGGLNIPARWVGAFAGVTTFGKNNFAYTDDGGSYIVIHTLLVDQEFEYDNPSFDDYFPPECNACIKACPTKALSAPYHLDPKKCIASLNWITQGDGPIISSHIPHDLRPLIGCKIHGCDICQDVCPRNQKKKTEQKKQILIFLNFRRLFHCRPYYIWMKHTI